MEFCAFLVESLKRPTVTFKTPFVKELVGGLVMGLRHILHCDGYKIHNKERKSIDHIVDLLSPYGDEECVEVVKYLTSHILPRLVRDEEPIPPSFLPKYSTLFSHGWQRYLQRIFANHGRVTRRQLALATSFLQVKRYLVPLPKPMKKAAIRKMRDMMTRPCKTNTRVLDELERTCQELFPLGWDIKCPSPSYAMSNKACLERDRRSGGSQSFIFSSAETSSLCFEDDKGSLFYEPNPVEGLGKCREEQIIDFQVPSMYGSKDPTPPIHPNSNIPYLERLARCGDDNALECAVAQCDEPLKVRNITKNEWKCGILKPLQKMIHAKLSENHNSDIFNLTYASVDETIMSRISLFPDSSFVSGDYAAATDSIHSDATQCCIETILGNMQGPLSRDPALIILAKKSLTGLYIESSEGGWVMKRGQLMGSLLSFPILCIINFAIWRHSTELTLGRACNGKGLGGKEDHVLINGDDIGFAATRKGYESWKALVPTVGLKPSAGKNYFSKRFLMLNSRLYVFDDTKRCLVNVPFLNLRLLKNPGEECLYSNIEALGKMHDDFVVGSRLKNAASGVFIAEQKNLLKMSWRNLFGPRELGGLGATPCKGSVSESMEGYSVRQLVIAKLLHEHKVKMPCSAMVQRYDAFQKVYLDRLFPDVFMSDDPIKDHLETVFELEDVTEIVGDAKISFLHMVSWLSPRVDTPRKVWEMVNRMKTLYRENIDKRHLKDRVLDVATYLETRGLVCLYRPSLRLFGEEVESTFL
jgi:hypothetical protein